jgi:glycosyltransferase involved in cell wall biosynthesis
VRVAFLSPLPPARTGIAHYASMLLPALRERADVTAFASMEGYRRADFDQVIYQLGNNPHHEWIYAQAMREPGIAVLHDLVLHHLIVEMTLARGDADGYVAALRESHGEMGAAWARGRAAGLHSEMGNFLLPASIALANRSRAVIVHNDYALERLLSFGVTTPIHVVAHPYIPEPAHACSYDPMREKLGLAREHWVVGLFGFLTSAKRAEVIVEAFRRARERDPNLRLLIVGEPAPNIDLSSIAGEGIITTGYVADDEFGSYYAVADCLVNLRYPSAGETSGTLIRAFAAGKPVAVSDYAQFAELPDSCVVKVPFGDGEVDVLTRFFLTRFGMGELAVAQYEWLQKHARLELAVEGYEAVWSAAARGGASSPIREAAAGGGGAPLSLFPRLELLAAKWTDRLTLTVRNAGDSTIRARMYGQPGYRLIALLLDGDRVVQDRWLELPGDLAPGASADVSMSIHARGDRFTLRLYDALEGIPPIEPDAWASTEIRRVS